MSSSKSTKSTNGMRRSKRMNRAHRRWRLVVPAAAIVAVMGVSAALGVYGPALEQVVVPLSVLPGAALDRISVAGQPTFWAGINFPWKPGPDFGTAGWGHSGVSDATTYLVIDGD